MTLRPFGFLAFAAAAIAALALLGRAPATPSAPYAGKPEIVVATFASAWCSACKILEPKLASVAPQFAGEPVVFVDLDFTFGPRDAVKAEATRYRLDALYEAKKGATGFALVVDYDTGETLDALTMDFSEDALRAAIARALAVVSYTDETSRAPAAAGN